SNPVEVEVTDAVMTAIQIAPASLRLAKGQTAELKAIAIYNDQTTSDISEEVIWSLTDSTLVSISASGEVSGVKAGVTEVTASKGDIISKAVRVEVTDAFITEILVTPTSLRLAKGQIEALKAMAVYSDQTRSDISDDVAWEVAEPGTASVSPSGEVMGIDVGSTEILASKDGITSNSVGVEVTDAVITSIEV
ncbi:Ig-like domain-containing protein, partial [Aeromonas veronii]|uniref:Ig-like domain-containing protein n=1 Tax=Aeromonas veronii TaxID=654 RepID=UPI003D1DE631